ncbi:hypothetical protein NON00_21355 [Roseomonas sp. GC11]|uniref:hypothetical protein n=1 Tax=Roseomonas sp. GC11 TaxID=2950546 RepID=UPI00210BEF64|nr:hypothetical protein [Roseomonas sp. GC11]MCQ4162461.1 hypothetical protein [Roseomonas sp. GC11]
MAEGPQRGRAGGGTINITLSNYNDLFFVHFHPHSAAALFSGPSPMAKNSDSPAAYAQQDVNWPGLLASLAGCWIALGLLVMLAL